MRSSWRFVFVLVLIAIVSFAQKVRACGLECHEAHSQCLAFADWNYLICELGCHGDWGCSVVCRGFYWMDQDICETEYDYCYETCQYSSETTCAFQCADESWSSIACLQGETASCTCTGEPVQANPSCTPPP